MRQETPEADPNSADVISAEKRTWYAQIASISNSVMLVSVLLLGCLVAYTIGEMRSDLHVVSSRLSQEAPSLKEKDIQIAELREENSQLKARLEELQRGAAAANRPVPARPATPEVRPEKLSGADSNLAECINAALNGKGSADKSCALGGQQLMIGKHG